MGPGKMTMSRRVRALLQVPAFLLRIALALALDNRSTEDRGFILSVGITGHGICELMLMVSPHPYLR